MTTIKKKLIKLLKIFAFIVICFYVIVLFTR